MSPQAGFLLQDQIVPRLRAVIPRSVLCVGSEDHEELVQDATCMAARIMHNGEQNGKRVPHSSAAYYAIQHCKSGRRAVGHSAVDVHGSACQLQGKVRVESMEEVVAIDEVTGGEILLHDVLSNDQEDPGTRAARKMDWEDFVAALPNREKAVIQFMIEGKTGSDIARKLKVSNSSVQTSKRRLAIKIVEFMGPEILIEIQRKPQWKQNLEATKERLACKHERSH
jgi:DNA-directed RNA polymerase specialized sigma24 family protein